VVPVNSLSYALAYAARGWPTFVLSETKVPVERCVPCKVEHTTPAQMDECECLLCHGFHAATTDPARLTAMFDLHPRGLVAIRTGAESGTVVIDVDPPIGLETLPGIDEAGVLSGTLMQMTGRDGGFQMFYGHPGVRVTSRAAALGPGVDVKADGAYVVAPPSRHPRTGRAYQWSGDGRWDHPLTPLHPLLVERLQTRISAPRPVLVGASQRSGGSPRGRLGALLDTVLHAPSGKRNDVLWWAARKIGAMVLAAEVDEYGAVQALTLAAQDIGLTDSEIRLTIASGLRRGAA
jgi:hypothetical protein